jgi:integrase
MRRRRGSRSQKHRASGPHVFRRGAVWYGYAAHHVEWSLRTRDEAEALKRFAEELPGKQAAGTDARAGEKALEVIGEKYLEAPHGWTRRSLGTARNRVIAFVDAMFAMRPPVVFPSQITKAVLDAWRKKRMSETSRATINRDEDVARAMMRWGREHGLCGRTPVEDITHVKEPRRKPPAIIPSPREVATVATRMRALGEHGAALTIAVATATGLRIDELRHMGDEWIQPGAIGVVPEEGSAEDAWTTKGYAERRVPVSDTTLSLARQFVAWKKTGRGGKGKPIGLADTWIATKIDEACAKDDGRGWSALPSFRMHDLRRTFATECVRGGIPITTVREWMGHVDVSTTELYLGRYRDDVSMTAPTPAVLDVFGRETAQVVSLATAAKLPPSAANRSTREPRAAAKLQGENGHGTH